MNKYVVHFTVRRKGLFGWLTACLWRREFKSGMPEFDLVYRLGDNMNKTIDYIEQQESTCQSPTLVAK